MPKLNKSKDREEFDGEGFGEQKPKDHVVRIHHDVYRAVGKKARAFEKFNDVLRRLLGVEKRTRGEEE